MKQNLVAQSNTTDIKICPAIESVQKGDSVYQNVDVMPEFPGGRVAFFKYIRDHVNCNCKKETEHSSKIITSFVVDTGGVIRDVCTVTKKSYLTSEQIQIQEAIKKSSPWKPGTINEKKVAVHMIIPVNICIK